MHIAVDHEEEHSVFPHNNFLTKNNNSDKVKRLKLMPAWSILKTIKAKNVEIWRILFILAQSFITTLVWYLGSKSEVLDQATPLCLF